MKVEFQKAAFEIWPFSLDFNPLSALAQPVYKIWTSLSHMLCILSYIIILKRAHVQILIFVALRAI